MTARATSLAWLAFAALFVHCSQSSDHIVLDESVDVAVDASSPAEDLATSSNDAATDGATQTNAFYVATSGNDANSGSIDAPLATLAKAQTLMRASTTIKTTFIREGSYAITTPLSLTSADDGETWSYFPPDGYDKAVLDGAGTLPALIIIEGGSHITIDGLKLQHTLQYGIYNHGGTVDSRDALAKNVGPATGNIFKNNEITGMTVKGLTAGSRPSAWLSGCIADDQVTPQTQIVNNYCHDVNSMGIRGGSSSDLAPMPGDFSDTIVSGNYVSKTCVVQSDCGAIYFWNPNKVKSTGAKVTNNFVKDYSPSGNLGHAIYFDYESSNITVSGNIVSGATNTAALLVSDGDNNVFTDNLLDLQGGNIVLLYYINITGHQSGTGNLFTNNVVLVNAAALTAATGIHGDKPFETSPNKGPLANFVTQDNFYCNYHVLGSGPYNDTGNQFSDTHPVTCAADPGISGWSYDIAATSPVFAAPVSWKKIPGGWGPPGFVVPQTGTAPSP